MPPLLPGQQMPSVALSVASHDIPLSKKRVEVVTERPLGGVTLRWVLNAITTRTGLLQKLLRIGDSGLLQRWRELDFRFHYN